MKSIFVILFALKPLAFSYNYVLQLESKRFSDSRPATGIVIGVDTGMTTDVVTDDSAKLGTTTDDAEYVRYEITAKVAGKDPTTKLQMDISPHTKILYLYNLKLEKNKDKKVCVFFFVSDSKTEFSQTKAKTRAYCTSLKENFASNTVQFSSGDEVMRNYKIDTIEQDSKRVIKTEKTIYSSKPREMKTMLDELIVDKMAITQGVDSKTKDFIDHMIALDEKNAEKRKAGQQEITEEYFYIPIDIVQSEVPENEMLLV